MSQKTAEARSESFSERAFYLSEFRGRTLAIAAAAAELGRPGALESVLQELGGNGTRVVLMSDEPQALEAVVPGPLVDASEPRLEGEVWRGFAKAPQVGVWVGGDEPFARRCREIALRLGLAKLVWIDAGGGLCEPDGRRDSFVDLEDLRRRLREGLEGESASRAAFLREVEMALEAGLAAVNLCTLEGLSEELFTYAGSGTLFTRERYVTVRRLGLEDYDAAHALVSRGVAEGYLAPRSEEAVDRVLANGFGAFVEGSHLAGIGALLDHPEAAAAEIVSLYTLTRFLGEGVGAHLVGFALDRARREGRGFVFACTTSDRVAGFFERNGFRRVEEDEIPEEKWRDYDPRRRPRVRCLRREL